MRYIKNTTFTISTQGGEIVLPMTEVIESLCKQVSQGGVPVDEQRKRFRILDRVDADREKDHITLEDADHETLKSLMKKMTWAVVDRAIGEIDDLITNAPRTLDEAAD